MGEDIFRVPSMHFDLRQEKERLRNVKKVFAVGLGICALVAWIMACGMGAEEPQEENLAHSQQALSTFSSTLLDAGPVGYWRLGETTGTTANDTSGHSHPGTYVGAPTLGAPGSIGGDTNGAVAFPATGGPRYVQVPDHDDFSLVKMEDYFERAGGYSTTWGTSPKGDSWGFSHGGNSIFAIDSTWHYAVIDAQAVTGNWGQWLHPLRSFADADIQVRGGWTINPTTVTSTAVGIQARSTNAIGNPNEYRAEIRTAPSVSGALVTLRVVKVLSGTTTQIASFSLGTSPANTWWWLRFQLQGTNLRARAWVYGSAEPTTWQIATTDSSFSTGQVGLFSSNSGGNPGYYVYDEFRVQSVGMTVHARIAPTGSLDFTGAQKCLCSNAISGLPCSVGPIADYVAPLSKNDNNPGAEWTLRFYPHHATSADPGCPPNYRDNRLSAYAFAPTAGQGSGRHCGGGGTSTCKNAGGTSAIDGGVTAGAWHSVVATYDPGDAMDTLAQAHLWIDGFEVVQSSNEALYSAYAVTPGNTTTPLRIGAAPQENWGQFVGSIDEVAIFDRALSAAEIMNLHVATQ